MCLRSLQGTKSSQGTAITVFPFSQTEKWWTGEEDLLALWFTSQSFDPFCSDTVFLKGISHSHIHLEFPSRQACVKMCFRTTHPCLCFLGSQCSQFSHVTQNPAAYLDFAPIPVSVNPITCASFHAPVSSMHLCWSRNHSLMEVSQRVSIPSQIHSHYSQGFPPVYTLVKTGEKEGVKGWRA